MEINRIKQRFFFWGLIAVTLPLLSGAGLANARERVILSVLSLLLIAFSFSKLNRLLNFTLFLSVFTSAFLSSQFVFLNKIDFFNFQAVILILLLFQRKSRSFNPEHVEWVDSFSLGILCLVIATFILQFFVTRILLGFYLNLWIDLKRHWPVFLFGLTYFIMNPVRNNREAMQDSKISNGVKDINKTGALACYFAGLFILTIFIPYFNPGEGKGLVTKKIERNLAFFYKDTDTWKKMSSSFRRGLVYEYLGLWPKARSEFKRILVSSPQDMDAHFNLARSYQAEKLWYEAMSEYNKVVETDPFYCGSHYGLAGTYRALGEMEKAEKEFLKEIEINPNGIKSYLALEELYKRQGLLMKADIIKSQRLLKITASIDNINDANLRILPVVLDKGSLTIEIVAKGTYAQGFWPRMEVWLSAAGELERVGDAWVKTETWKSYYFHFKASPGEERLIVHFTNDFFGGAENDRNLYIRRINFIYED